MELNPAKMLLSVTDEISMVGTEKVRNIRSTACRVKGAYDNNCVLTVGDLNQLLPI